MPSLQALQDQYEQQGLRGEELRHALERDTEYQRVLAEKQAQFTVRVAVTPEEQQRYVFATDRDYEILAKCRALEVKQLSEADARIVQLIRTQLETDWRTPLLAELDRLLERYGSNLRFEI